jgi:NAD(P)-dependent dehydrogenase (short-subunit alcohol dehydrogenase family)
LQRFAARATGGADVLGGDDVLACDVIDGEQVAAACTVSKRALTAYADVLRLEYGTHLSVTTVYPGYVNTAIHERSRRAACGGSRPAARAVRG